MQAEEVKTILDREPFVPLRLKKTDGKSLDIPFRVSALPMKLHLLVFKGIKKEGSHVAKSYEAIGYDYIAQIQPRRTPRGRNGRRKAS